MVKLLGTTDRPLGRASGRSNGQSGLSKNSVSVGSHGLSVWLIVYVLTGFLQW